MDEIGLKLKKDSKLYRELFFNAAKTFKELVDRYKSDFSCNKCSTCCKIRYSKLPPEEIKRLAEEENDAIAQEYLELFAPYDNAPEHEYAKLVISKHDEPIYFYYCKHADEPDKCTNKPFCKDFPDSITTILPQECGYREWQDFIYKKIINEIGPDISQKVNELLDYKKSFECKRTGICCRLAGSEFTHEELKQKALNNDNFAAQFVSVFIPYENIQEARKVYPEYVDYLVDTNEIGEKLNLYHCKYLQGTNECPIYEDRPKICRDFPDNPFCLLPETCGFYKWKEEVVVAAYTYYAMMQVYGFYYEKIRAAM